MDVDASTLEAINIINTPSRATALILFQPFTGGLRLIHNFVEISAPTDILTTHLATIL